MPEAIYAVDFVEYMSAALNLQKPYISSNSLVKFLYSALILPKILQKILKELNAFSDLISSSYWDIVLNSKYFRISLSKGRSGNICFIVLHIEYLCWLPSPSARTIFFLVVQKIRTLFVACGSLGNKVVYVCIHLMVELSMPSKLELVYKKQGILHWYSTSKTWFEHVIYEKASRFLILNFVENVIKAYVHYKLIFCRKVVIDVKWEIFSFVLLWSTYLLISWHHHRHSCIMEVTLLVITSES